jgi:hypothetical protein
MSGSSRMPGLVLPFAVVGGAAGWLTAGFLRNPFIAILDHGTEGLSAAIAAGVAAVVGWVLSRLCEPPVPWESPRMNWVRLVVAVVVGGGATGILVGGIERTAGLEALASGLSGALAGAAFVPVCALVVAAAKRAQRARLGSLVAGSDRRAVWGILASALGAMTAAAALDWPFVGRPFHDVQPPLAALAVLGAAGLVVAVLFVADVHALRRMRLDGLEAREGAPLAGAETARRLDLGLGEGLLVGLAQAGAAAYRSRERVASLVVGDPQESRAALRRALVRGALGLFAIAFAGSMHVAALHGATSLYRGDMALVPSLGRMIDYAIAGR